MISSSAMGMPLHFGKVPTFLTERMGPIGEAIVESIVDNYGAGEVLTRMSDQNWFQALGAVMGMHWNSSEVTATMLGSLKKKINLRVNELGLYILVGKGKSSQYVGPQINKIAHAHDLDGKELARSARLAKRIDSIAVMDGFGLYMQYFLLSDKGERPGSAEVMPSA